MAEQKKGGTSNRGFASMDPAKQRAIASKGGSSVPPEKRPFAQNHKLAAEAGRKGGENSHGGRRREREIETNVPDDGGTHGTERHEAAPSHGVRVPEHN
ncbi:MAG TPA: KGG domain-containing protein [Acidisphaera sp.]|nr:KGG domain-containing protein [Acidisphaera sp.]